MELDKTLKFLGLLYSVKLISKATYQIVRGVVTFILPCVWPQRQLAQEYGSWAVITGCTRGIGYYYVKELAAMNIEHEFDTDWP